MRELALALAAAACVGLGAPAFATDDTPSATQSDHRALSAPRGKGLEQYTGMKAQYAGTKKKGAKKKEMTKRSSWGG